MEVANTSQAQRTNIDSIGSIILCKLRVGFNRRAVTAILYAVTNLALSTESLYVRAALEYADLHSPHLRLAVQTSGCFCDRQDFFF